jgi:hypothetical protein
VEKFAANFGLFGGLHLRVVRPVYVCTHNWQTVRSLMGELARFLLFNWHSRASFSNCFSCLQTLHCGVVAGWTDSFLSILRRSALLEVQLQAHTGSRSSSEHFRSTIGIEKCTFFVVTPGGALEAILYVEEDK